MSDTSRVTSSQTNQIIPFAKKCLPGYRSQHTSAVVRQGDGEARSVAVSGPILLMRPPDILIMVQMARDVATCMYYTGIEPFTREEVHVAQGLRDRKLRWVLLQFFKPENWFTGRNALLTSEVLQPLMSRPVKRGSVRNSDGDSGLVLAPWRADYL
jgi:hypothetical protein